MNTPHTVNLQLFSYESKEIRCFIANGDAWFVLTDVCEAINASVNNVLGFLGNEEKSTTILNGRSLTIINEPGCYHVIVDLNTQLDLTGFRKFVSDVVISLLSKKMAEPQNIDNIPIDLANQPQVSNFNKLQSIIQQFTFFQNRILNHVLCNITPTQEDLICIELFRDYFERAEEKRLSQNEVLSRALAALWSVTISKDASKK